MQDIKQTLLSSFEERYKEFKEYSNFFIPYTETVKENILNQELLDSLTTPEKIEEFMLENNLLPQYYSLDMERLKERLITCYEDLKDFIEIPQEVKEEMDTIIQMKTKMIFKIVAQKPEAIDPSHIELIKNEIKKSKVIKNTVESLSK